MVNEVAWVSDTGYAARSALRYHVAPVGAFVVVYVERQAGGVNVRAPLLANGNEADANAAWTEIALPSREAAKNAAEAHATKLAVELDGTPEQDRRDLDLLADYINRAVPPANWTPAVRVIVAAVLARRALA